MNEENVLCAASSYSQKYYFNPRFDMIPERVKKELKIMCVTFTEETGGVLVMEFSPQGKLMIRVEADDGDYLFDEIESGIRIGRMQQDNEELFGQLELCYRVMFGRAGEKD